MSKIRICKDASGVTWGYQLFDNSEEDILSGDGYESPEKALEDLTSWGYSITTAISSGSVQIDQE